MPKTSRSKLGPRLVLGLGVIFVGLVLTLDNMGVLEAEEILIYWPVALIAIGLTRIRGRTLPDLVFAGVFIGLGLWILLFNIEVIDLEPWRFFWPLVLIVLGINLTLGALRRWEAGPAGESEVNAFAFLSSVERKNNSPEFRGADLTAIMGGCKLDLRQAAIGEEPPVIRVFAFWGGIDILVPREWSVDSRVLPLLGGYEDRTEPLAAADGPRVTIRGAAIMGGVDVKN